MSNSQPSIDKIISSKTSADYSTSNLNSAIKGTERYLFADAIRGIAAISVVMRHVFYGPFESFLKPIFPSFLETLHIWGAAGVYAFFVLSGFVIAHSLRNNSLSSRAIGNFILRRQIRLDPVYWAVLALTVALSIIKFSPSEFGQSNPSIPNLVVNMFYLQGLLNKEPLIGVAWTLCIEIQFYLIFILLLLFGSKAHRLLPEFNVSKITVGLVFCLGIGALILKHCTFNSAYFISFWHYFAFGTLAYWGMQRVISPKLFFAFVGLFVIDTCFSDPVSIYDFGSKHSLSIQAMVIGLLTATSLYYAGTHGLMSKWGKHPILQYLGRISYSLYLIHGIVIMVLSKLFFPAAEANPIMAIVWYISVYVVSIGMAQLLYMVIEKPSMKFASKLKIS